MKKAIQVFLLISFISITTYAQEVVRIPELKRQIDSLKVIDQQVQQDYIKADQKEKPTLLKVQSETFVRHTIILKQILAKYGFPTFDKVGKESSNNYWLCVQHCDHDLQFQKEVLKLMKKGIKNKNVSARNYAYLTDRVNLNSGKPQIYGTQLTYKDRTAIPRELIKPATVNKRRKSVDLEPLEDYLKMATDVHRQMNSAK